MVGKVVRCPALDPGISQEKVDRMIQDMDNPLLSQFVNKINSAGPQSKSKLYSSWSVCEDEGLQPSMPECQEKSLLLNYPSGIRDQQDMDGLHSHGREEPNHLGATTDWDSLSRLFPPLWTSHNGDQNPLSKCFINDFQENGDPNIIRSQGTGGPSRCLPDMESIQRGFQDLGLLESWVSNAESCNPQVEDLLKDVYIENPDLKRTSALKEIEGPNQSVGDYLKYRCKDYATNSSSNYGNTQKRVKEFSCLGKPVWKSERGKGKFQNNDVANQSNSCVRSLDDWCKEKYSTSYDCIKAPVNGKQSANGYNYPFPKERGFQNTGRWKPFNEPIENHYNGFSSSVPFDGYENFAHQTFAKTLDYESLGNAVNLKDNIQASSIAQRWLDNESQKISSPLPSPSSSTFSDESPTHNSVCPNNYFGHVSPTAHSSKDGLSQVNGTSGKMPFSNFGGDDQRSGIQFANSPKKEAMPRKMPPCFPPAWTHQKQSFVHNTNSEKYHKTPKRHSPQNNPERRGKKNWSTPGNTRPNSQQYNSFQRKPEPNIGNVSDFINASFLPYSLMSDFKQNQNFPSLNQPGFPSPGTMSFPPPPFPFSDLIDLFQYEDLNHMNPFLSDLFCGDLSPPYFPYPTPFNRYRPPRNRSGPANELHMQLEEGCEQWRALEKERKKTEADLARNFPGTRVTSSYSSSIPRLPTNPSRVDRLIVDQLREHSRAVSLVKIMEKIRLAPLHVNISLALELHLEAIHLTQARRKDEIVNAANRQKQGAPRYNNEKDVLALAAAIKEMVLSTRKARTALWCALQITLPKSLSGVAARQEDVERALMELVPKNAHCAGAPINADTQDGKKEISQSLFQMSSQ